MDGEVLLCYCMLDIYFERGVIIRFLDFLITIIFDYIADNFSDCLKNVLCLNIKGMTIG